MALTSAFQQNGPTVLVGVSAVQPASSSGTSINYRVRCLVSAYLTYGATSGVAAAGAPGAGAPVANTVGMTAGVTEVFSFPANSFFISNLAASFEITPGEGL